MRSRRSSQHVSLLVSLSLASALALAPRAHAQRAEDTSASAAARALFEDGVSLARRGLYADAADRFQRAYTLRPTAAVAYNLAGSLVHLDRLVEASELFAQVLRDESAGALRESAERQRASIAPRIGRLTLHLAGDADGVSVEIDGREIPAALVGAPAPIDPGEHTVRALRGAREVALERVRIADGEARSVELALPARPAPRAETAPAAALELPPVDSGPGGGDEGWIVLGVVLGVAAVAAGVTTAVLLAQPSEPTPVGGNTMPGVLTW